MAPAVCRLSWSYGWDQDACEAHAKQWLTFHRIKGDGRQSDKSLVQRWPLDGQTRTWEYWTKEANRRIAALRKRDKRNRGALDVVAD